MYLKKTVLRQAVLTVTLAVGICQIPAALGSIQQCCGRNRTKNRADSITGKRFGCDL